MAKQNEDPSFSLHALVEQTARMLRDAIKPKQKTPRNVSKDSNLSNKNKIERIASILRSEAKRAKRYKKKKSR